MDIILLSKTRLALKGGPIFNATHIVLLTPLEFTSYILYTGWGHILMHGTSPLQYYQYLYLTDKNYIISTYKDDYFRKPKLA